MMKLLFAALFLAALATFALTIGGAAHQAAFHLPLDEARPLTLLTLSDAMIAVDPRAYWRAWVIAGGALGGGVLALLAVLYWPAAEKIHGDARFARPDEIRAAGLRARTGVILGKTGPGPNAAVLRHDRETHTLLVAPTGAGKGVGVVIPNLLTYGGSALVVDVKGENWTKTAGARAALGDQVVRFSPRWPDGRSHRWNPLAYVSDDPARRVADLRKLAVYLLPVAAS